jgi:hypothetical protein
VEGNQGVAGSIPGAERQISEVMKGEGRSGQDLLALTKAVVAFDQKKLEASLARIALAARSEDVKTPKLTGRKRRDVERNEGSSGEGRGSGAFVTNMDTPRATRL